LAPEQPRRDRQPDEQSQRHERVIAEAVVDHAGVEEDRREPIADDPVSAGAVGDGVLPQSAWIGDEKGQEADGDNPRECGRGLAQSLPGGSNGQQHDGEEGDGDERELLQRDRGAEARRRPHEAAAGEKCEGEHEREERRRVRRSEPGPAYEERVGGQHGPDREPPVEGAGKEQRGGQESEGREQDEEAIVVEGPGQEPPRGRGQRRPREVREVAERDLRETGRLVVGGGVEALEP